MLQIIEHRKNTIESIQTVSPQHGVEIDVRSDITKAGQLHLEHDPWKRGENFATWLAHFARAKISGPLIINTKEDGLEEAIELQLEHNNINNYFFLDTAAPTLIRRLGKGLGAHMAARISSHEPASSLATYRHLPKHQRPAWLWVDCFDGTPRDLTEIAPLAASYCICLVSPELQGYPLTHIAAFSELRQVANAVCTKSPTHWQI